MRPDFLRTTPLACLLVLTLAACAGPGEEAPQPAAQEEPPQRVDNPELGIALADVPDDFRLVANDAEGIRLETQPDPDLAPGTVAITVGEAQRAGVNLVQGVRDQQEYLESQPEGKFLGQVELMGPTGTAYSTRGRYQQDGTTVEEIRLLALHPQHPDVNRMLSIQYVYEVSGDTKERLNQAMEVLGEVVPPKPEETTPDEDPATQPGDSTGS